MFIDQEIPNTDTLINNLKEIKKKENRIYLLANNIRFEKHTLIFVLSLCIVYTFVLIRVTSFFTFFFHSFFDCLIYFSETLCFLPKCAQLLYIFFN